MGKRINGRIHSVPNGGARLIDGTGDTSYYCQQSTISDLGRVWRVLKADRRHWKNAQSSDWSIEYPEEDGMSVNPDPRTPSPESRVPNPETRIPSPDSVVPSPESRAPSPVSFHYRPGEFFFDDVSLA